MQVLSVDRTAHLVQACNVCIGDALVPGGHPGPNGIFSPARLSAGYICKTADRAQEHYYANSGAIVYWVVSWQGAVDYVNAVQRFLGKNDSFYTFATHSTYVLAGNACGLATDRITQAFSTHGGCAILVLSQTKDGR